MGHWTLTVQCDQRCDMRHVDPSGEQEVTDPAEAENQGQNQGRLLGGTSKLRLERLEVTLAKWETGWLKGPLCLNSKELKEVPWLVWLSALRVLL